MVIQKDTEEGTEYIPVCRRIEVQGKGFNLARDKKF